MKKWLTVATTVFCGAASSVAFAQEVRFETYVVKKGDTCTSIAKQFYGDAHAYDNIHKYNDLAASNYACVEGTELKIPIFPEKPEAQLTARYGKVRAKSPQVNWTSVDVGAEFFPAWRVNTLEKSSAELGFSNDSKLQMSENTLVVIYGPDKNSAAISSVGRATVERGRLRTFLNDLSGEPMVLSTPSAKATLNSGSQQITVDEGDETRFANHEGEPLDVTSPDGQGKVVVKEGFGSRVKKNQRPEKPRKLPDAPLWKQGLVRNALILEKGVASLIAEWEPVNGVSGYRVELSRDRRQLDMVFSKNVPDNITKVDLKNLPAGNYYLSVVSIDDQKFESVPSEILKLEVLTLRAPKNQLLVENGKPEVMIGSQIFPPKGATCKINGAPDDDLIVRAAAATTVTCLIDGMELSYTLGVVKPTFKAKNSPLAVAEGGTATTEVTFEPLIPTTLKVNGPEGLDVKYIKNSPKVLQFSVTDRHEPPGDYELTFKVFDTVIGSLPVRVEEKPPAPSPKVYENVYPTPYVDVMVGYDAMISLDAGTPLGGTLELGMGVKANSYFAAELRAGYGYYLPPKAPKKFDKPDQIISARLQAMVGWMPKPVSLYATLGGLWRGFLRDPFENRMYAFVGLGVMPYINDSFGVRIEGNLAISSVDFKFDYLPEVRVGIQYSF